MIGDKFENVMMAASSRPGMGKKRIFCRQHCRLTICKLVEFPNNNPVCSPQRNDLKGGNTDDKLMTGRTEGLMTVCQKAI